MIVPKLVSGGERESTTNLKEKGFDGQKNEEATGKQQKTVMRKRLSDGKTIQIDLISKAQLLTIFSGSEEKRVLTQSLIIQEGQIPRIVLTAEVFGPVVSVSVLIVEKGS